VGTIITYPGVRGTTYRIKFQDASGKRRLETLRGCTSYKEAEKILAERETDVRREGMVVPDKITFRQFASEWLEDYVAVRGLKRSTASAYKTIVDRHLIEAFGSLKVGEVTVDRIERQVAKWTRAGQSARTVNANLQCLGLIFRAARKRKLVASNPVELVDRPRERRAEQPVLSAAEIRAVDRAFLTLDEDDASTARALFLTAAETGLRRGELLGLKWSAVGLADPNGPMIQVRETWVRGAEDSPKSAAGRRAIPISPQLADVLFELRGATAYQGDDERCFPSSTGHVFDVHRYSDLFKQALRKAGIDPTGIRPFHGLRHSSLTLAASAGMDPYALQTRAGHSSQQTTARYLHLAGVGFRRQAEQHFTALWGETKTEEAADAEEAVA
jgi:integrase